MFKLKSNNTNISSTTKTTAEAKGQNKTKNKNTGPNLIFMSSRWQQKLKAIAKNLYMKIYTYASNNNKV